MNYTIIDVEADGLLDEATKIHCLSYCTLDGKGVEVQKGSITDYQKMREFLINVDTFVGHFIIRYDIPLIEKILEVKVTSTLIDTLGISWYLWPTRNKHGLESWGIEFGTEKVKIENWENQTLEEYIERCEQDVEINRQLFIKEWTYLLQLYDDPMPIINYLNFKMFCLKEQEEVGITLDTFLCDKTSFQLEYIINEKVINITKAMPKVLYKTKPQKYTKKDGTLSATGVSWLQELGKRGLPLDSEEIYDEGNPNSSKQVKDWLDSLGWVPETFTVSKATGEKVPQVSLPFGQGICHSVKELYEICPELENLEGLAIATHRLGILKSYKKNLKNGKVIASASGLTNTLRLTHSAPVVNLPAVDKPFGAEVRGCLTVPNEDYVMIGTDLSSLEDSTKQHYIFFFDPSYVTEMRVPGFCPHIDISVLSGLMTQEDADFYKWYESQEEGYEFAPEEKSRHKTLKKVRHTGKTTNFSATYNAGPAKIAETAKISFEEGKKLHKIYWERNKAIKQTVKVLLVKEVEGQKWQFNPISKFWYFLKAEKDQFSTLNQGSGSYVFDVFLSKIKNRIKGLHNCNVVLQYHDEGLLVCLKKDSELVKTFIREAKVEMNEELSLNVEIGCSIEEGLNYAECH